MPISLKKSYEMRGYKVPSLFRLSANNSNNNNIYIHFFTTCTKILAAYICMFVHANERVTGRKARGLQMEERGCKCQTFFSLLSGRKNKPGICFSFSIQI